MAVRIISIAMNRAALVAMRSRVLRAKRQAWDARLFLKASMPGLRAVIIFIAPMASTAQAKMPHFAQRFALTVPHHQQTNVFIKSTGTISLRGAAHDSHYLDVLVFILPSI